MKYSQLFSRDQLRSQIELKNDFLQKFEEGQIQFPPTYKLGKKYTMQASILLNIADKEFQDGQIEFFIVKEEKFNESPTVVGIK